MIKVAKRDGTVERFDKKKIYNAVFKSSINSKYGTDSELASTIADLIEEKINKLSQQWKIYKMKLKTY